MIFIPFTFSHSHETIFNGMKILLSKIFQTAKKVPSEKQRLKRMCMQSVENVPFHCGNEKWWGEINFRIECAPKSAVNRSGVIKYQKKCRRVKLNADLRERDDVIAH